MALTTTGFAAELLFFIGEEIIGSTIYFQSIGPHNSLLGTKSLAAQLITKFALSNEPFGDDCRLDCVRVVEEGSDEGWSWEIPGYQMGGGPSESIFEMHHQRVTLISELQGGERVINRPQFPGAPADEVTGGRLSGSQVTALQDWFVDLADPGLDDSGLGLAWKLAARRKLGPGSFEYRLVERISVNPFVGTRIDRVRNRPNTGKKAPVAP